LKENVLKENCLLSPLEPFEMCELKKQITRYLYDARLLQRTQLYALINVRLLSIIQLSLESQSSDLNEWFAFLWHATNDDLNLETFQQLPRWDDLPGSLMVFLTDPEPEVGKEVVGLLNHVFDVEIPEWGFQSLFQYNFKRAAEWAEFRLLANDFEEIISFGFDADPNSLRLQQFRIEWVFIALQRVHSVLPRLNRETIKLHESFHPLCSGNFTMKTMKTMKTMYNFIQEVMKVGHLITKNDNFVALLSTLIRLIRLIRLIKLLHFTELFSKLSLTTKINFKIVCKKLSSQLLQLLSDLMFCDEAAREVADLVVELNWLSDRAPLDKTFNAQSCVTAVSRIINIQHGNNVQSLNAVEGMILSSGSDSTNFLALSAQLTAENPQPLCPLYFDVIEPLRTKDQFPQINELLLALLQFADLRAWAKSSHCVFPIVISLDQLFSFLPEPLMKPLTEDCEISGEDCEFEESSAYQLNPERLKLRNHEVLVGRKAQRAALRRFDRMMDATDPLTARPRMKDYEEWGQVLEEYSRELDGSEDEQTLEKLFQ
jgi:hypothetical protein